MASCRSGSEIGLRRGTQPHFVLRDLLLCGTLPVFTGDLSGTDLSVFHPRHLRSLRKISLTDLVGRGGTAATGRPLNPGRAGGGDGQRVGAGSPLGRAGGTANGLSGMANEGHALATDSIILATDSFILATHQFAERSGQLKSQSATGVLRWRQKSPLDDIQRRRTGTDGTVVSTFLGPRSHRSRWSSRDGCSNGEPKPQHVRPRARQAQESRGCARQHRLRAHLDRRSR